LLLLSLLLLLLFPLQKIQVPLLYRRSNFQDTRYSIIDHVAKHLFNFKPSIESYTVHLTTRTCHRVIINSPQPLTVTGGLVCILSEDRVNLDEKSRIKVEKRIVHPILKTKFKLLEATDD
jgi:hypothetical protein